MHFSDEWRSEDRSGSQHSRTSIRTTGPFFLSSLLLGGIQPTPGQHQLAPPGWRKLLPLLPRPTGRKSSSQRSPRQAWTTRVAAVEQLLWTTFPSCPGFAQAGWSEVTNAERRTVSRRVAHRVRGDAHRTTLPSPVGPAPQRTAGIGNPNPQPPPPKCTLPAVVVAVARSCVYPGGRRANQRSSWRVPPQGQGPGDGCRVPAVMKI